MSAQIVKEPWQPRVVLEAALQRVEARFETDTNVSVQMERAGLLAELGRTLEARAAYLEVLAQVPADRLALNNLGTLLLGSGHRTAARMAYAEAVAHHPSDPMSRVNLANVLYESGEFSPAREHYEAALRAAPLYREAHKGLSYVLDEIGDSKRAAVHRRAAFENHAVETLRYRGNEAPVRVLLLVAALGGNIPTRHLLDDQAFETTVVVPVFYDLSRPLPPHQLIFNAIGDADLACEELRAAQALIALSEAPVVNAPDAVMATGRAANAARLSKIPGVVSPEMMTLRREELLKADGLRFPLLLRTPGFHTGRHFVFVENVGAMAEAVAGLPGAELTVIQYLDSRGTDGKSRKYRVMMIGEELYPLHLAISSHWKIHYFTAEMADNAAHRAEDAAFLDNMPEIVGPRAMTALAGIQKELGLDYGGVDFGLSPEGDVLLYEANSTMVVNPPESDECWAYRRPAVERIFAAVRGMLMRKMGERRGQSLDGHF